MEEKPTPQTATPDVTFRGAALWFRNSVICPNTAFKHVLTLYIGFQWGYHEYSQLQKRKKKSFLELGFSLDFEIQQCKNSKVLWFLTE